MALVQCPECAKTISDQAQACPSCGFALRGTPKWNRGVAAVLSLVIPGAGQMHKGQVLNGLVWLGTIIVGYIAFILRGSVLHHLCCDVGASTGDSSK